MSSSTKQSATSKNIKNPLKRNLFKCTSVWLIRNEERLINETAVCRGTMLWQTSCLHIPSPRGHVPVSRSAPLTNAPRFTAYVERRAASDPSSEQKWVDMRAVKGKVQRKNTFTLIPASSPDVTDRSGQRQTSCHLDFADGFFVRGLANPTREDVSRIYSLWSFQNGTVHLRTGFV